MKQYRTLASVILAALVVLSTRFGAAAENDAVFNWSEAAGHMDALPFSRPFIDSVTNAHIGGPAPAGLRKVEPGRFVNGETLVYEIVWGPFKGGYLILSSQYHRSRGLLRLSSKAMTTPFISAFYKLRDYMISWVDVEGMYPRFFEQHVREGNKYSMDSYIVYDAVNGKLHEKRRELKEHDAPPFTHDLISAIYYARSLPLNPGDAFEIPVYSKGRVDPVKFKVRPKRETVQTDAGAFNCVIVDATFFGRNRAYNKNMNIEIWVSDDERKRPVMIKTKTKFGAVTGKLIRTSG